MLLYDSNCKSVRCNASFGVRLRYQRGGRDGLEEDLTLFPKSRRSQLTDMMHAGLAGQPSYYALVSQLERYGTEKKKKKKNI